MEGGHKLRHFTRVAIIVGAGLLALAGSQGLDRPVSNEGNGEGPSILDAQGSIDVYLEFDGPQVFPDEIAVLDTEGRVATTEFGTYEDAAHYGTTFVNPGDYRVRVRAEGYADAMSDVVRLRAGERPAVTVALESNRDVGS